MSGEALIIGGGLAGMACAIRLAERNVPVTLLETRKKLGGRATSFQDVRSGRWLDNCQHVVLGCCTNYLDLLGRLGVRDKIVWHREQHWIEEGGRTSTIGPGALPAPAHFTRSFLGASFLSLGEKLRIARACSRILRVDRRSHAGETFAAFLGVAGQTDRLIRRFWSPIVVSACNLDTDRVSAAVALHVFQEGFLANTVAADIGVPGVPLLDLYENAGALIERSGGRVLLGEGVESIDRHGATTTSGERHAAEFVVCAVPVERVNRMISDGCRAGDDRFARLDAFTHSPILGVHLTFDRPVLPNHPHAVLVDRPTQWLFRKDAEGTYLHAVISTADAWLPLTEEQIGQRVLADIHACLPASRDATLVSVRAVKEKLATFAPTPGIEKIRPRATGPSGIILAGDYTDTGWPATMEGATRSGYTAAAAVLGQHPNTMLIPPLPIATLARLAGLREPLA
ncbi:MAG TPA: hydroxysqualene dehydroxylase HpnE [Phycisphaerales bacterium]|nr:hydroxysqualene dehydroxylase HpnE [Phycisphaerales bacterium]